MGVTYPTALLLGLALAGVPTLVHFLARPRPVRLPYSTVRFLREAIKHRRALFRFRDLLVLLLRVLAVIFLAAAFARLFSRSSSAIALEGDTPTVRVVLLDASQSMQARRSVVQVFDRAKATARRYVHYRSALKANVIVCAGRAQPLFERLSENLTGLEAALATVQPRYEALDVRAALTAAARMLTDAGGGTDLRRELIVISDLQQTNWQDAPLDLIPTGVNWRFDQVGLRGEVANLAVCDVRAAAPAGPGQPTQLTVEVGNFSDAQQSVAVEVHLGDATYRSEVDCPPWGSERTVVSLPAGPPRQALDDPGNPTTSSDPQGPGWLWGTVRLARARDVLPADDERPFVVPVSPLQRYILLSRDDPSKVATSRYFLQRALCAGVEEEARMLDPAHPDVDLLVDADLIIVVQAGRLPADTVRLLASLLVRGSSVLYVAEGIRDVENLVALEKACGKQLRLPVAFSPGSRPHGSARRLNWVRTSEQPFKILAAKMDLIRAVEFSGGLGSVQRSGVRSAESGGGTPEDVLASFDDGAAALVVTACGRGRLAVLNADLEQSRLPASPLFVPLVQELADRLTQGDGLRCSAAVGQPVQIFLPASTAGARETSVVGPSAVTQPCGVLEDTETGVLWHWDAVEEPGVYRVVQRERVVQALAAACPRSESDLRLLDPEVMVAGVAGAQAVEVRRNSTEAEESERRQEWWPWLMMAAAGCLLVELGVLKLFRT